MRRHHLPGDLKQLIFDTIRPMLEARNRSLAAKLACRKRPLTEARRAARFLRAQGLAEWLVSRA